MTTTPEDIQAIINSINDLSALVGRYAYGDAPEEADDAQRAGFAAVRRLTTLKDELSSISANAVQATLPSGDTALEQEAA